MNTQNMAPQTPPAEVEFDFESKVTELVERLRTAKMRKNMVKESIDKYFLDDKDYLEAQKAIDDNKRKKDSAKNQLSFSQQFKELDANHKDIKVEYADLQDSLSFVLAQYHKKTGKVEIRTESGKLVKIKLGKYSIPHQQLNLF